MALQFFSGAPFQHINLIFGGTLFNNALFGLGDEEVW